MADEINENNERIDETYTEFGGTSMRTPMGGQAFFTPTGRLGRWFAKFFATKAQPYVADQGKTGDTPMAPLAGDTVVSPEVITSKGPAGFSLIRSGLPQLPELEINRKQRYKEYESMDEYPEVGAAFDIYADDSSQKDTRNNRWIIKSDDKMVVDEISNLFDSVKLDRFYWDITRNTVKYGDCFIELILNMNNPKAGIQRLKVLNPSYILRVENEYGYLTDFLQEIPKKDDWSSFGGQSGAMQGSDYITLDKNQIVHFRLHNSDPAFYPYGKSIAALAHRIFRSLKLMEDAMLIYRLQRAPERRIFYIDTGNLPATKSEIFMERLKEKFKKEKFYNASTGAIDQRYNPLSTDEDFFVPVKAGSNTKIETLPGAQNLGEVDDVKYFRDKLLAALKIPKDYIVEKEQSPERKANLSQLDIKFARTVSRIQHSIEIGLELIAKRHLQLKGYPLSLIKELRIELPDPSDMFTKRKLDLDEQKARVVQAVLGLGLIPKKQIYKEYYDMSDDEIEEFEKLLEDEMEKQMQQEQEAMMAGGGLPPAGGDPMPPMGGEMAGPGPMEAGGQESDENIPPTATVEAVVKRLEGLKKQVIQESGADNPKSKTLIRAINKLQDKVDIT